MDSIPENVRRLSGHLTQILSRDYRGLVPATKHRPLPHVTPVCLATPRNALSCQVAGRALLELLSWN